MGHGTDRARGVPEATSDFYDQHRHATVSRGGVLTHRIEPKAIEATSSWCCVNRSVNKVLNNDGWCAVRGCERTATVDRLVNRRLKRYMYYVVEGSPTDVKDALTQRLIDHHSLFNLHPEKNEFRHRSTTASIAPLTN